MNRILEPRKFTEILSETFNIYGKNFLRLAAIAAITAVISGGSHGFFMLKTVMDFFSVKEGMRVPFSQYFLLLSISSVIVLVVSPLVDGALIYAVSEQHFQQPISFSRAYRFAWSRAGFLMGSVLLYYLIIFALVITIIGIPAAVYLGIRWSFIRQAALLEGCGVRASFSRSSYLVKQNWWRVFGILLVVGVISGAINSFSGIVPVLGYIFGALVSIPITATATTLLYYDLRVRKEGYNLEKLAEELHLPKD